MLKLENAVNSFVLTKKIFDKKKRKKIVDKKKKKTRRMRGGAAVTTGGPGGGAAVTTGGPGGPAAVTTGGPPAQAPKKSRFNLFGTKQKTPEEKEAIKEAIKKAKEAKILDALKIAIQTEYDNCLVGLETALKDQQNPKSKIIFHKAIIHIPIVIEHLNLAKNKNDTFTINQKLIDDLNRDIKRKIEFLEVKKNELNRLKTKNYLKDDDFPEGIKEVYTPDKIKEASVIKKISKLITNDSTGAIVVDDAQIPNKIRDAKKEYADFLELVENARKSIPQDRKPSFFSFGSSARPASTSGGQGEAMQPKTTVGPKAPAGQGSTEVSVSGPAGPVFKIGGLSYKATTDPDCTANKCVVTVQKGGSRKSKRSKTLKGGRRRR